MIWVSKGFSFFFCLQNNFWFTFWPLNKVQLLDPLNCPLVSLLPPSVEGKPVWPCRWGFIGGDGITNYTFRMTKQAQTPPQIPHPIPWCDPDSKPCRYGGLHNVGGYKLFSASFMKHWLEKRPLSLQPPRAAADKSHHTQRDLWHGSWRILKRFKSVYNFFCLLRNGFIWIK